MKKRKRVPGGLTDRLMAANRHTCCICREPRHPVEKHHIDDDPSNNQWNNLAVLCRNCHGVVTVKGSLGARYTPGEVLRYKLDWEKRCAEAEEDEIDSPVEVINETRVIEADGGFEIYPFEMDEGQELVFSVDANDALDVVVCDEDDAEAWSEGEDDEDDEEDDQDEDDGNEDDEEDQHDQGDEEDDRPLPPGYLVLTGLKECRERKFTAPEDGSYALLLVNWDDEDTEVAIDAAVWPAED
jgi:hypothetical protein